MCRCVELAMVVVVMVRGPEDERGNQPSPNPSCLHVDTHLHILSFLASTTIPKHFTLLYDLSGLAWLRR